MRLVHGARRPDLAAVVDDLEDRLNAAVLAARGACATLWDWVERHHIDALAVIAVTLWLTIDVVQWAKDFADDNAQNPGMNVAAIIGAVLTPWGLMQAAMFKFYADLKGKSRAADSD